MPVKFTIVTPSFNQGRYLRKTLDSVAAQTFEDYEHLIFDPGSTDESLAIAESYCLRSPKARLVKGRDKSQTNAINLGFEESCSSILCWLNSDDQLYDAEVLVTVNRIFDEEPDVDIVYGRGDFIAPDGKKLREAYINRDAANLRSAFANSLGILQPSLYLRKSTFLRAGQLDEKMNYSFDYEYWARCAALGFRFRFLDRMLSKATIHDDAKTMRARGTSLLETAKAAKRYYDFLSIDWVKRIVDEENNGNDGIIASSTSLSETDVQARFYAENRSELAMARYFNDAPAMNESTREMFAKTVVAGIDRAYLSSWDKNYFDMGITLIASIHRHDPDAVTFVCDIGMSSEQLGFIAQLRNVILLSSDFPPYSADWQKNPKNYVFKNILFEKVSRNLAQGTNLLWMDAGVSLCEHPARIFKLIEEQGCFFIDHDDSSHWPLFNASFTSDDAITAAKFTYSEMAGSHVCSCLFGVKVGSPAQPMFELAAALAHDHLIAVGDKHPPETAKIRGLAKDQQIIYAAELRSRYDVVSSPASLRPTFGYLGHRQDQSIISAVAARFNARISSAKSFCPANDMSSVVSKENWFEGISKNVGEFRRDNFNNGSVTFHHRGLVKDFTGLRFAFERKNICAVIGNGPSLSGVDFALFEPADCIGMNAAYRFWQTIDWYPAIYCCLDTIVGLSHKEAIADLVRNRRRLGIKQFLLRRNLVEWLESQGVRDGVVCFDLVRSGFELLDPEPITTGSHSLAWGAVLGYEKFLVAGVDCNYVEKVDGAMMDSNNILEIVTEDRHTNANYFFDGYQQVGDKFNIPNPSKDLHIRSWRNVASRLDDRHTVVNVSEVSRVDAFPKQHLNFALEYFSQAGKSLYGNVGSATATNIIKYTAVLGPFDREAHAHYDETDCVAVLYSERLSGRNMIDVGAHFGTALAPFLDKGWNIYAFEPDENNRGKLLERLAKHKNKAQVTLDTRCVSNKTQKGVSFFTSEQSTGISGLSAFHETHHESQKVDITTLTEFFQNKPLPVVDFLKIDTEGHDLFVLQGFPWDRGQPAVIECEFEDTKTVPLGYTFHDLARFLVDKGYTVYVSEWHPIVRYGIRHDWRQLMRYPCELADSTGWGNLLAFRETIDEKDLVGAVKKVLKVGVGETAKTTMAASAKAAVIATPVKTIAPEVPSDQALGAGFRVKPSRLFAVAGSNLWRYTHSDAPQGVTQKLWVAAVDAASPTAGRSFVGGIRLQADRAMTVNVTLGRDGKTDWEGAAKRITLAPGVAQSVKLKKDFANTHDALKLQVEVLELEGGSSALLTIDGLYMNESLASIRRRAGESNFSLREANRLFREGDYSTSMALYLLLHQQRPVLKMYPDNALMAARKLGMDSVRTVDDLLQRVS